MKIFYVRHGQSQANVDEVYAGKLLDSPLTELGREQALAAANEAKELEDISVIVASPLLRAHDTAKVIATETGLEIETEEGLAECSFGVATGKHHSEYSRAEVVAAEGAELPHDFQTRILDALKRIAASDRNVLIVAHGAVMSMIEATYQGLDPADYRQVSPIPNAEIIDITDKIGSIL